MPKLDGTLRVRVVRCLLCGERGGAIQMLDVYRLTASLNYPGRDLRIRQVCLVEVEDHFATVLVVHVTSVFIRLSLHPTQRVLGVKENFSVMSGAPGGTRTHDPRFRKPLLLSSELPRQVVIRAGFKPATPSFGGSCSIRLSYRIKNFSGHRLKISAQCVRHFGMLFLVQIAPGIF